MNKMALLAAVAASAMVASPALAGGAKHSDAKAEMHTSKKMHHSKAKHMKQSRAMQSDRQAMNVQRSADTYYDWDVFGDDRRADAGWNRGTNTGFAPLDFATGVTAGAVGTAGAIAGGAVNTAGAIATAPFRDDWSPRRDSFAYYDEPIIAPAPISTLNGPTCQPGNWTTINGARMRCQ